MRRRLERWMQTTPRLDRIADRLDRLTRTGAYTR